MSCKFLYVQEKLRLFNKNKRIYYKAFEILKELYKYLKKDYIVDKKHQTILECQFLLNILSMNDKDRFDYLKKEFILV